MHITHVAIWTRDLEALVRFYCDTFAARAGEPYHNPAKQFSSRFIYFEQGATLELMHRPGQVEPTTASAYGLAHLAFALGSEAAVNTMTQRLKGMGLPHLDGPRHTGDGYYESAFLDPEGNTIELTI